MPENGQLSVRGFPTRTIAPGQLAGMVEKQPDLIERESSHPANTMPIEGLAAWRDFGSSGATYSSGTHLAVVEINLQTGELPILTYVAVDDCGRVLNHRLVDDQLHGGMHKALGRLV